ncbi:hypothetical protein [Dapis sp. BLCC M229]|uniref:hypothetical protein n=1 Tax=Dapis sp. BLCC M229 TaxID=3400188 RepID=UPI003CF93ABB
MPTASPPGSKIPPPGAVGKGVGVTTGGAVVGGGVVTGGAVVGGAVVTGGAVVGGAVVTGGSVITTKLPDPSKKPTRVPI